MAYKKVRPVPNPLLMLQYALDQVKQHAHAAGNASDTSALPKYTNAIFDAGEISKLSLKTKQTIKAATARKPFLKQKQTRKEPPVRKRSDEKSVVRNTNSLSDTEDQTSSQDSASMSRVQVASRNRARQKRRAAVIRDTTEDSDIDDRPVKRTKRVRKDAVQGTVYEVDTAMKPKKPTMIRLTISKTALGPASDRAQTTKDNKTVQKDPSVVKSALEPTALQASTAVPRASIPLLNPKTDMKAFVKGIDAQSRKQQKEGMRDLAAPRLGPINGNGDDNNKGVPQLQATRDAKARWPSTHALPPWLAGNMSQQRTPSERSEVKLLKPWFGYSRWRLEAETWSVARKAEVEEIKRKKADEQKNSEGESDNEAGAEGQ